MQYIPFISLVLPTLYRVWVQQIPCESMICKGFFFVGYLKCTLLLMDKIRTHPNLYSELTFIFNHTIKFKIYFLSF